MALSWVILRTDPAEAALSSEGQRTVQSTGACVPSIWAAEVTNTLLVFQRAKRLSEQDCTTYLFDIELMEIVPDVQPVVQQFTRVLDLARRFQLSSYDASYLELALRKGLPLATFDRKLSEAARSAGVPVFGSQS